MELIISAVAALTVFTLLYLLVASFAPAETPVALRLRSLDEIAVERAEVDEDLARPFAQRVISPLTGSLAVGLGRLTPASVRRMVSEKLAAAGGFQGLGTDGFLLLWGAVALAGPLAAAALAGMAGLPGGKAALLMMTAFVLASVWPLLMLNRKIAARKAAIQKELPDVLDLLTVSVEAGLGFDGALAKVTEKMSGPLVDEFARALQEMLVGVPRRDALHSLGRRCDVADLLLFVSALVQADQLGVSIGNVLRIQSAAMREKRRQRAQEQAMKAPVKMLLPLVMCIFPTLFVILLGPAVIQIVTSLGGKL
jgi:tight adherence protein C